MKTAIRYHSKFGHTKQMVETVKDIVACEPQTVNTPIEEPIDLLLLGAGVFLGKVDGSVTRFIEGLTPDKVKRVVCFGSCAIVKSPVPQMRKALEARGITVTTENYHEVTSEDFLAHLSSLGCRLVFYVEYVPFDESTSHLAFLDEHVAEMEQIVETRRERFKEMIFLSFPGDEKALDGCMAAGRGFFHIGPDGAAEPCPFSPFSDSNVAKIGLRQALQSPLFSKIRNARALGWEHTGGYTLYEHREEVEKMCGKDTLPTDEPRN